MEFLIPVASGLESVVKRQLYTLGYDDCPALNGRILVRGKEEDVGRLNVFLRSGERVLLVIGKFVARTFDEFFDGIYAIPFEEYLTRDSLILMNGKSSQSALGAVKALGGVAKKAIIRRLADKLGGKGLFPETGARTVVDFSLYRDEVTVSLDTSGDGLHKRGYRSLAYSAPLKETLAAALVDLSLYRPQSDWEKPFADPFCGSGTLPIEAALKAKNIAVGAKRSFDFEKWKCFPSDVANLAREEAKDVEKREVKPQIYGGDISPEAIKIAKFHARQAGVEDCIRFEVNDAEKFTSTRDYGVIVCNPPYGERLESAEAVKPLYRAFGKVVGSLPTWSTYVLTSFPEFERYFGRRADRKKRLFNANLPCTFYTYFGERPQRDSLADDKEKSDKGDA